MAEACCNRSHPITGGRPRPTTARTGRNRGCFRAADYTLCEVVSPAGSQRGRVLQRLVRPDQTAGWIAIPALDAPTYRRFASAHHASCTIPPVCRCVVVATPFCNRSAGHAPVLHTAATCRRCRRGHPSCATAQRCVGCPGARTLIGARPLPVRSARCQRPCRWLHRVAMILLVGWNAGYVIAGPFPAGQPHCAGGWRDR